MDPRANQLRAFQAHQPAAPQQGPADFMSWFEGLPPDQKEALIAQLGRDYGSEGATLDADKARAEALRNAPVPLGRRAGGMYHAANPLEHIGAAIRRYKGARQSEAVDESRSKLQADKQDMLSKLIRGMGTLGR